MLCSRVTSLGCLCTGREEGENRVTNGLHYRKIKSPSRCEELERNISQIGVHSSERSNAFSASGSPGICGCPWDRRGCLAQLQRNSQDGASATEKMDPKCSQPQPDFFGPEPHPVLGVVSGRPECWAHKPINRFHTAERILSCWKYSKCSALGSCWSTELFMECHLSKCHLITRQKSSPWDCP